MIYKRGILFGGAFNGIEFDITPETVAVAVPALAFKHESELGKPFLINDAKDAPQGPLSVTIVTINRHIYHRSNHIVGGDLVAFFQPVSAGLL